MSSNKAIGLAAIAAGVVVYRNRSGIENRIYGAFSRLEHWLAMREQHRELERLWSFSKKTNPPDDIWSGFQQEESGDLG